MRRINSALRMRERNRSEGRGDAPAVFLRHGKEEEVAFRAAEPRLPHKTQLVESGFFFTTSFFLFFYVALRKKFSEFMLEFPLRSSLHAVAPTQSSGILLDAYRVNRTKAG